MSKAEGKTPVSADTGDFARGYQRRVWSCVPASRANWTEELTKWGFKAVRLSHREISQIREEKAQGVKPDETTFYICSYEQLSSATPPMSREA